MEPPGSVATTPGRPPGWEVSPVPGRGSVPAELHLQKQAELDLACGLQFTLICTKAQGGTTRTSEITVGTHASGRDRGRRSPKAAPLCACAPEDPTSQPPLRSGARLVACSRPRRDGGQVPRAHTWLVKHPACHLGSPPSPADPLRRIQGRGTRGDPGEPAQPLAGASRALPTHTLRARW